VRERQAMAAAAPRADHPLQLQEVPLIPEWRRPARRHSIVTHRRAQMPMPRPGSTLFGIEA